MIRVQTPALRLFLPFEAYHGETKAVWMKRLFRVSRVHERSEHSRPDRPAGAGGSEECAILIRRLASNKYPSWLLKPAGSFTTKCDL